MAEIVLHFRNRNERNVTATVQTPVVFRFTNKDGQKKRVVVRDDAGIKAITLSRDIPLPNAITGQLPPGLVLEDDVGPIAPTSVEATASPPPPPGGGPGVCYDIGREVFCW